jgi:hyperosmotically inducible periplasmic protein
MHHTRKLALAAVLIGSPLVIAEDEQPKEPAPVNTSAEPDDSVELKADNTKRNTRERSNVEKTPVDQNENKSDIEITRRIRSSIVSDKELSTYAHNIKIITQDGVVNLKGPVRSTEEKATVEFIAEAVAGKENVKSQIELAPKDK